MQLLPPPGWLRSPTLLLLLALFLPLTAQAALGDIGIWHDSAGSQAPGTTWGKFSFAAEDRNDGAHYAKAGDQDFDLGEAGNYLILYFLKLQETNRAAYQTRVTLNGTEIEGCRGAGYTRQSRGLFGYARGACLALNVASTDDISVEYRRDTLNTPSSVINASELMIVRITDDVDAAYAHYSDGANTSAFSGTAWNDVSWDTIERETNTAVIAQQTGSNIRLIPANTRFLVIYSVGIDNTGDRTHRISRAVSGATPIETSHGYTYMRQAGAGYGPCIRCSSTRPRRGTRISRSRSSGGARRGMARWYARPTAPGCS